MKFIIFALACLSVALAAQLTGHEPIPILHQDYHRDDNGNFKFAYETGNGILAEAEGHLKNAGTDAESFVISGRTLYTNPEGQEVGISYVADEEGYRAEGPSIPQPQAIPELILRGLEWARTHHAKEY